MFNIVLVEPEIPQNTGNIARTCAATGSRLHLVKPLGFEIDDKKLKRAGLDYWHLLDITFYENIDDFFEKPFIHRIYNFFMNSNYDLSSDDFYYLMEDYKEYKERWKSNKDEAVL